MDSSITRKKMPEHTTQMTAPIQGGCALLFSLPFMGMGGFLLLVTAGLVPTERPGADMRMIGGMGAAFFLAGSFIFYLGIRSGYRNIWVKFRKKQFPESPWLWDYPWNPSGVTRGVMGRVIMGILFSVGLTAFMTPFNIWAFFTEESPLLVKVITGFFDLFTALVWVSTVYYTIRALKYGSSRLRFQTFPFHPGDTLELFLSGARSLRSFRTITVTLRFIEEEIETHLRRGSRSQSVAAYSLFTDTLTITPESGRFTLYGGRKPELLIKLPLPDTGFVTRLSEKPPRYWQLEITADTPGVDYGETFLLPVYARTEQASPPP